MRLKLAPVETPLPEIACLSMSVTLPVVLAVMFGVETVKAIAPEPVSSVTEVPSGVPAPVIDPLPVAVYV